MFFKTPRFWYRRGPVDHLLSLLLAPLSWVYAALARKRRLAALSQRVRIPVICVGNLVAGGAGKTPAVIALARLLIEMGHKPHIVSRGYGGRSRGPLRVDPQVHDYRGVGDEPLLLSAVAPVWVAGDRVSGARAALAAGADIVLLDDGFQNPYLHKDLSLVVVDAASGFGNGRVIPAGPLREPVTEGLRRASALLVIGGRPEDAAKFLPASQKIPVLHARILPDAEAQKFRGRRAVAFAGIGRPEKFLATLQSLGTEVLSFHAFPDHKPYRPAQIWRLVDEANSKSAWVVTTVKDAARVPADIRPYLHAVPVSLHFSDEEAVRTLLQTVATL